MVFDTTPPAFRLALASIAVLLLVACEPQEGDACASGARCTGANASLFCIEGRYRAIPCGGARGCHVDGTRVVCDESIGSEGQACTGSVGACTADGTTLLTCTAGQLAIAAHCRGPAGCSIEGTAAHCDQSVGAAGDTCRGGEGVGACTADGAGFVLCEAGTFVLAAACRGPLGCRREGTRILCDESAAMLGDPCTGEGAACSTDGTEQLRCTGGTMRHERDCVGGCRNLGALVTCDGPPPGPATLTELRAHFGCEAAPTIAPCRVIAAYEHGHAPATPTGATAYVGIRRCVHDQHGHARAVVGSVDGTVRVSLTASIAVSGMLERSWPALEAALAAPSVRSTDPEVSSLLADASASPALLSPSHPSWELVPDADSAHVAIAPLGTLAVREHEGALLVLEGREGHACITELRSLGPVTIDDGPTVVCSGTGASSSNLNFAGCADGHTYEIDCVDGRCTCIRDAVRGTTFERPDGGVLDGRLARRECGYPVQP